MNHILNILKVFKRDMKSIIHNPIALIIITGICILPSLYAWVNIKACWNPYENTSTIPVAIVNKDKMIYFKDRKLNMGNEIVKNLKANKKIGWKFVSERDADLGIVDGTYYAEIEIPEDFSSSFVSILSDNPKKPQITYKVNTKENPVAGKITDVAKDTLIEQITSNFIVTVNQTLFSSLNEVGQDAEKNKENIIKVKNDIININNNMDLITNTLQSINISSGNLGTFLTELRTTIPSVESGLNSAIQSNENNGAVIKSTQTTLNNSTNNIQTNLDNQKASIYRIQTMLGNLNEISKSSNTSQFNSVISEINSAINSANNSNNAMIDYLQKINSVIPKADISNMVSSLKNIQTSLADEKNKLNNLQQDFSKTNSINKDTLNSLISNAGNLNSQLTNSINQYNSKAKGSLNSIGNSLITATNDATSLMQEAQETNQQIDKLMGSAIEGTTLASKVSGDLNNRLLEFKDTIAKLSSKLQLVNNNDLQQIISILQSNPRFMGDFIAEPFNLKDESIYTTPNYGSSMAPIYTVLAIWVGALLLTSILTTKTVPVKGYRELSIREKHFGKMLTFITLAVIQSFIVSLGDKFLLGVYTVNTPLMIAFALVSGITFSIIVYTLVSVLGNVGKAIAIILLIVQVAGSGGTYPIQVDPLIFRIVQPMLPFTYSIGGFRESIGGPLISTVFLDFSMLIIISIIFILFGFLFKKPLDPIILKFEERFKKSGIGE
ncbi:YhgE/Pip domain-containing protein [Clostridium sp.]|jgi:putative membrane protein|uniref:YhgE/Pip domain-containing protein n=1 Tax=Clostridium sp. TaxID=1506 RepID=UPI002588C378|nr:YhgE/Pip domain-containing protein [Clostridium sp.]MDF2505350.1 YhgE/Pip-like protein [Clostridium sp.]